MEVNKNWEKREVFDEIEQFLAKKQLKIDKKDENRPWGGFFVIDEEEAEKFISHFFPHLKIEDLSISGKLSPKILLVAPQKRLSWQYHHRRAEIWKLIGGEAGVITSDDDKERQKKNLQQGDIVELKQGERHRLIGVENWGIIAEIWRHTDKDNPSDEEDIVRLQDDFGR
ncbi:MAG: phosphoheptose isomerase [Niastella sp.]|nr:phosphoheptose isomerase [Niastella sp.]